MAIVSKETQTSAGISGNSGTAQTAQPVTEPTKAWSFSSGGLFGAPIGRSLGAEILNDLCKSLETVFAGAKAETKLTLIKLDRVNEPSLAFSCVVVAMQLTAEMNAGLAYHILIVEASGEKIPPLVENINGQQVEIFRVPADALDDRLVKKCSERLSKQFPGVKTYLVDGCVVPEDFDCKDVNKVHLLALNAGLAVGTELEMNLNGFNDLNLAAMPRDNTLAIDVKFDRKQLNDAVGHPMRSDVIASFVAQKQVQGKRETSLNSGDRESVVSVVSGFVDLVYDPVINSCNNIFQQQQVNAGPVPTQKYRPRFIITNLASNIALTPSCIMLALYTALSLNDNNNWVQTYRPNISAGTNDFNDIGAMNIEVNLFNEKNGVGGRVDVKGSEFGLPELGQYIGAIIRPGLIVSIDVPEYGPQSWYLNVFAAAANRNSNAYNIVIDACNSLTNGNFSKYFPKGGELFTDLGNRVHLGYWHDQQGNKRDIRDIDTLAVANIVGERNPQAIRDWQDTFLRTDFPIQQRMFERKRRISAYTNETAVFTGYAQRLTLSTEFLVALSKGVIDTGTGIRINTPLSSADLQNTRGVATFASAAVLPQGASFAAPAGFGGFNNGAGTPYNQYRF